MTITFTLDAPASVQLSANGNQIEDGCLAYYRFAIDGSGLGSALQGQQVAENASYSTVGSSGVLDWSLQDVVALSAGVHSVEVDVNALTACLVCRATGVSCPMSALVVQ